MSGNSQEKLRAEDGGRQQAEVIAAGKMPLLGTMLIGAGICALLTLPMAWAVRHLISGDGGSYLEMATNSLKLGPSYLFSNGYWSPGYPLLIAIVLKLLNPGWASELIAVHVLDWLICSVSYLTFTYFFFHLLLWAERGRTTEPRSETDRWGAGRLPIVVFGYTLVLIANMDISLWIVGPVMLMEGLVYLAAGLALRLGMKGARPIHHVLLGLTLAAGYMAKAPMLPMGLALLAFLFVWPLDARMKRKGALLAAAAFILGILPVVISLSVAKGRPTFGDSGRLNYAWYVDEISRDVVWNPALPGGATLTHPAEILANDPPIRKFASIGNATFPYWYDPSVWYEGLQAKFHLKMQVWQYLRALGLREKVMVGGGGTTLEGLALRWTPVWAGMAAFVLLGLRARNIIQILGRQIWLLFWPLTALWMFSSVLLEYRYLTGFLVLGSITLVVATWRSMGEKKSAGILLTVAVGLLLMYAPVLAKGILLGDWGGPWGQGQNEALGNLAGIEELRELGIGSGNELASINFPTISYPAHLLGAKCDIQVLAKDPARFAELPAPDVERILNLLRAHGAKALVSGTGRPGFKNDIGWIRLNNTTFIRMLN
jgi:hypothetical protein